MFAAGMKGWRAPELEDWLAYQETHRARPYYLSWFAVRLRRVTGLMTPFQTDRRPQLLRFRNDLNKLPAVDRDLYLLWLCHDWPDFYGGSILATEAELLEAARAPRASKALADCGWAIARH
jgi:hypothetical protein